MYHKHFNEIDSTQKYLLAQLSELKKEHHKILITANHQTDGIGRKGNQWDTFSNAIAMSFTLSPHAKPTLSPLEIGVLIAEFFAKEYNSEIKLKWPNDLLHHNKKCGGILVQLVDQTTLVVGVGINLFNNSHDLPTSNYKHGLGYALNENPKANAQDIALRLYEYIFNHRQGPEETISKFHQHCAHLNKLVEVDDDQKIIQGQFIGIGEFGEALVSSEGKTLKLLSSSLKIIDNF